MFNFSDNNDRVLINTNPNSESTVASFNALTYSAFVSKVSKFASHTVAPVSYVITDLLNQALQDVINKKMLIENHFDFDRSIIFNDPRYITLTHWENKLNRFINKSATKAANN